jgi:uncharacterized protein
MELTPEEIRVLGCLVEKAATTPDNYPLSTNALMAACNQTTSRDPIVHFGERDVDQAMLSLREKRLARTVRGEGQRVHKHKHVIDEGLGLDDAEAAVLSVLMLRGAQTASECRTRTERYGVDHGSGGVEGVLARLAASDPPLVRQLTRRPGEREVRWVHLLGGEAMAEQAAQAADEPRPAVRAGASGPRPDGVAELRARVEDLERRFAALLGRLGETVE